MRAKVHVFLKPGLPPSADSGLERYVSDKGLYLTDRDSLRKFLSELIRRRLFVPQSRQVMGDQRVLDDMQGHRVLRERGRGIAGGSVARPAGAIRPSAMSFLTREMFDADQLLLGLRGVKRPA